ncbi:basic helix-loop-helix (bHLH) DNA-bindingsuperfamily protein [Striga asiatica]|uniref:Basic helix-loop-helix (BHLH) DNA-bindingsuperfamily protein n=1 Tax=Striga asiatica TaxID=4170 RepID=A0A5A7PDH4_STRAF|nr:basic helix-loop-helix (bHLH) DNA-bindingsuperfamily protein [Striga asiatica]
MEVSQQSLLDELIMGPKIESPFPNELLQNTWNLTTPFNELVSPPPLLTNSLLELDHFTNTYNNDAFDPFLDALSASPDIFASPCDFPPIALFHDDDVIFVNNCITDGNAESYSTVNCPEVEICVGKKGKTKKADGQPSKNLMAERRRRKRLNDRLSMLRSIVPKISKMDRTSILGDTIDYVKELLDKIQKARDEVLDEDSQNQVNIIRDCLNKEIKPDNDSQVRNPPKFDVERRKQDTKLEICCAPKPGLLLSTLGTLDALGLDIQQCVISCFADFSLQASCLEVAEHRTLVSPEDVKQALFRSADRLPISKIGRAFHELVADLSTGIEDLHLMLNKVVVSELQTNRDGAVGRGNCGGDRGGRGASSHVGAPRQRSPLPLNGNDVGDSTGSANSFTDRPPGRGDDTLGQPRVREQRRAGGGFGSGGERDDEETLGAVRFRSQRRPEEGFDYQYLFNRAALDGDFWRTASGFSQRREFHRRGPDREGSAFAGFELPRCRWDDRNFRRAEAGWGRVGHLIAEDAGDYHSRAVWPDERTPDDIRPRKQLRPDRGHAAAWEFDGRRTVEGWPDGLGRDRCWTDVGVTEERDGFNPYFGPEQPQAGFDFDEPTGFVHRRATAGFDDQQGHRCTDWSFGDPPEFEPDVCSIYDGPPIFDEEHPVTNTYFCRNMDPAWDIAIVESSNGKPSFTPDFLSILAKDGFFEPKPRLNNWWAIFRLSIAKSPNNGMSVHVPLQQTSTCPRLCLPSGLLGDLQSSCLIGGSVQAIHVMGMSPTGTCPAFFGRRHLFQGCHPFHWRWWGLRPPRSEAELCRAYGAVEGLVENVSGCEDGAASATWTMEKMALSCSGRKVVNARRRWGLNGGCGGSSSPAGGNGVVAMWILENIVYVLRDGGGLIFLESFVYYGRR